MKATTIYTPSEFKWIQTVYGPSYRATAEDFTLNDRRYRRTFVFNSCGQRITGGFTFPID